MTKRYHGNFRQLVKNGKPFTSLLVQGREAVQISDSIYHVVGMETLLTISNRAKVFHHRGYTIIRDCGRYHIFS